MRGAAILAIDQGTTNTKASLIAIDDGSVLGRASRPLGVTHPQPDWAEQSAEAIWRSIAEAAGDLLAGDVPVAALAIANQRETIVLWDAASGAAVAPAISWQCRRTSDRCAALTPHADRIMASTGLGIDPLAPSTKLAWLLDTVPDARRRAVAGELRAGTVDSWLVWKLTNGGVHATDVSNASRTQLMSLDTLEWDPAMLDLFEIPRALLPEIRRSDAGFGNVRAEGFPEGLPIAAVLGDSHAALLGHGFGAAGGAKVTCGTGSSLMTTTPVRVTSTHGLWSTIAWGRADGVVHALEGNVAVSGHAAAFACQLLGLRDGGELTALAASVVDSGGVTFVPALAGLGAPHWDDGARGIVRGLSLATRPAHLARAVLEGIAHQIADIVAAMDADTGKPAPTLSVDGGAAANDLLMAMLADAVARPVLRPHDLELGARGVAGLAAATSGLVDKPWSPLGYDRFDPREGAVTHSQRRHAWRVAVHAATAS